MPKNTLKLAEKAWLKHSKKKEGDVFPPYRRRFASLLKFCGIYPVGKGLPDWWGELVSELRNRGWRWSGIADLFENTTIEEFKLGQFQIKRHKECREKLREEEKKIISSPKIGKFLKEQFGVYHRFTVAFHDRGAKLQEKEIFITADPWDIVSMSTKGKSWTSCQNFIEYEDCEVWSNLCDPTMLVIFVRTKGDNSEKNVDTRVILRYAYSYGKKPTMRGVIIDKLYGDAAYIQAIQRLILRLCKKHGLHLFEYRSYDSNYRMKTKFKDDSFKVCGPWTKFTNDLTPYWEYHEWTESKKHNSSYRFEAEVRLIYAPSK